MSEKLKTLMHEHASVAEFELPDVDLLVRHGTRRARRRGLALVSGGVAASTAAVVITVAALSGGGGGNTGPAVANDPLPVDLPSYAKGSVIHGADGAVDVGHQVNAYVRTRVGYVVADPSGVVWSVAGDAVSPIGSTDASHPRLVTDPEGSLVGWVDGSGDQPTFVVFDQATGDTFRNDEATSAGMGLLADEEDPAYFYAIDDRTAYWRDGRGLVAIDVDTGHARVLDAAAANGFDVLGVENGVLATSGGDGAGALLTGPDGDVVLSRAHGGIATFSADARWVSIDADEPMVFNAGTGQRVPIELDAWFASGYEWLDDRTLVVVTAADEEAPVDLLTCVIPAGSCKVAVPDVGTIEELADGFALPVGESLAEE